MIPGFIRRFLERRRFPTLLLIAAALFLVNLLIADPLPFVDEVLMLIATLVIGSITRRRQPGAKPGGS